MNDKNAPAVRALFTKADLCRGGVCTGTGQAEDEADPGAKSRESNFKEATQAKYGVTRREINIRTYRNEIGPAGLS